MRTSGARRPTCQETPPSRSCAGSSCRQPAAAHPPPRSAAVCEPTGCHITKGDSSHDAHIGGTAAAHLDALCCSRMPSSTAHTAGACMLMLRCAVSAVQIQQQYMAAVQAKQQQWEVNCGCLGYFCIFLLCLESANRKHVQASWCRQAFRVIAGTAESTAATIERRGRHPCARCSRQLAIPGFSRSLPAVIPAAATAAGGSNCLWPAAASPSVRTGPAASSPSGGIRAGRRCLKDRLWANSTASRGLWALGRQCARLQQRLGCQSLRLVGS